jgi:N-acetylmuramoyl-L-alanine amidase CwlA
MTTNIKINRSLCHLGEDKIATFKNWVHKLHNLPLNNTSRIKELNTIITTAENKGHSKHQILTEEVMEKQIMPERDTL